MPRIFMSFRKIDERLVREGLYRRLATAFGKEGVFKSGESIPLGTEFSGVLDYEAARCEVLLALIGPRWLTVADAEGRRCIDRPDDWVRRELLNSYEAGNTVVPVLLGSTIDKPGAEALPTALRWLAGLQFHRIADATRESDAEALITRIRTLSPGFAGPAGTAGPAAAPAAPPSNVTVSGNAKVGAAHDVHGDVNFH